MLTTEAVEEFVDKGFLRIPGAFPRDVADACRAELWEASGCDPDDRDTWTEPVVRITGLDTAPFRDAANTPALHEAFDRLVGPGRWEPRLGLGTFPIRFPSPDGEPGDDGWHLDASFAGDAGEPRINLHSRGRALLMLFLFSHVGPDDAPTRIRIGSHRDVPRLLSEAGEEGREFFELCDEAVSASEDRAEATATGEAGDVFLCHPFLVHAAQSHKGTVPRFIAQPPLEPKVPLNLSGTAPTPVERAVLQGLEA